MFTKTKLAAAIAAIALGTTAFASVSEARVIYYPWGWGWGVPVAYSSYAVPVRHGHRICRSVAEYTDWGFYFGNSVVCSRH
jgi:hypothetical protein